MSKKAKARSIIVRLVSTAGTGFFYTTTRRRLLPKLSLLKHDPIGKFFWIFFLKIKL
jgi:large subunit ribosomal protein L33